MFVKPFFRSFRSFCAFVAVLGLVSSCDDPDDAIDPWEEELDDDDEERALTIDRLWAYTSEPEGTRATGVIFVPKLGNDQLPWDLVGGKQVRFTCGVTFISPRYAITAAHCVDQHDVPDPQNQMFVVETYDIKNVTSAKLLQTQQISGFYPFYTNALTLTEADGYKTTRYSQCHVVSRCDGVGNFGAYNCPTGGSPDASNGDVALIKCDDRPAGSPYVNVASEDPGTGGVDMYWYHEVYNVPSQQPPLGAPAADLDHWNHYTLKDQNELDEMEANYHYLDGNQMMPLQAWPDFHDMTWTSKLRQGHDPILAETWTNLHVCHGTSGSGVLQRNPQTNRLELLGPVSDMEDLGSNVNGNVNGKELLCYNSHIINNTSKSMAYTRWTHTRQLAALAQEDTNPAGEAQLRLVSTINNPNNDAFRGRLEIFLNGSWGSVCDDLAFGPEEAQVACRQLGYSGGVAHANAYYGEGSGAIHLDDVTCVGNEGNLVKCGHQPIGVNNCGHYEDVGLTCEGQIRLVSTINNPQNDPKRGRVEIFLNGNWGTICDDNWGPEEAQVACRELGYSGGTAIANAYFGEGSGAILLDEVNCIGSEGTLDRCGHRPIGTHNCAHYEDLSVICQ